MLRKTIVLILLSSLALPYYLWAQVAASLGGSGLKGKVRSYMEISLETTVERRMVRRSVCHHTLENFYLLGDIVMLSYTILEGDKIQSERWMRFYDKQPHKQYLLDRSGLDRFMENPESDPGQECYFFYTDPGRSYPEYFIFTDDAGIPFIYGTIGGEDGYFLVQTFTVTAAEIFTNNYAYDGGKLIYATRQDDDRTHWMQIYRYRRDGDNLLSSVTTDGTGYASSRTLYNRRSLPRILELYGATDGPTQSMYSYRYSHKGDEQNYTSAMRPRRGTHPYYNIVTYRVENGRVVSQGSLTGYNSNGEPGGRKNRGYDTYIRTALDFFYNDRGDHTAVRDREGGYSDSDIFYLYDAAGNWYYRTTTTTSGAATSLRSFRYEQ